MSGKYIMKTLTEFMNEHGYKNLPKVSSHLDKWFAYKEGKVFGPFDLNGEAKLFSTLTEKVRIVNPEYADYSKALDINNQLFTKLKSDYEEYCQKELGVPTKVMLKFCDAIRNLSIEYDYNNEENGLELLQLMAFAYNYRLKS